MGRLDLPSERLGCAERRVTRAWRSDGRGGRASVEERAVRWSTVRWSTVREAHQSGKQVQAQCRPSAGQALCSHGWRHLRHLKKGRRPPQKHAHRSRKRRKKRGCQGSCHLRNACVHRRQPTEKGTAWRHKQLTARNMCLAVHHDERGQGACELRGRAWAHLRPRLRAVRENARRSQVPWSLSNKDSREILNPEYRSCLNTFLGRARQ